MRQLVALPTTDAAQTLADHLQTLHIETRLEPLPEGAAVWVLDEDRLPQAREELAAFTQDPINPRFTAARRAADAARRRQAREPEAEAAPRPAAAPAGPLRAGPITYGLILASVLVFTAHTSYLMAQNEAAGSGALVNLLLWWSPVDLDVWTSPVQQALSFGGFEEIKGGRYIPHGLYEIRHGQVWRLVTPIFLHFGLVHLLFNMTWLYQLGGAIEARRGWWRYLLFVLASAVLSNSAQYFLGGLSWESGHVVYNPNPLGGGMSGVIYALFGYVWMKSRYEPGLGLALGPRTVFWMIAWLFLCMTGAMGPIGNVAHAAGLVVGVVIGVTPHLWRLARGTRPT